MLVNYHSPTSHAHTHVQDHGLAFVQDTDASGCGSHGGHGGCGGSNRGGRSGRGGSSSDTNTNATTFSSTNNINTNTNEPVVDSYIACSLYDSHPAACLLQNATIPARWIVLDSCSTVDMIANEELLHDIKPTSNPINTHCNAGTVPVNKDALMGDYPEQVWFNPHGITNILSLQNVSKHYRVTMDTNKSTAITLHCKDGSLIPFTPGSKGLYHYALQYHESLNNFWSMISTVAGNAQQFTKQQYCSNNMKVQCFVDKVTIRYLPLQKSEGFLLFFVTVIHAS
jgi:hypothetical protein